MSNPTMREFYPFQQEVYTLSAQAEQLCKDAFARMDEIALYNEAKVLKAFADNGVSETHFAGTTGYGYDDRGRDVLDMVYAQAFGAEDALVRHNFVSGTHALATAIGGILRPGDTLLSISGSPYDTMEEVIGIRNGKTGNISNGSLVDFGVKYEQIDLLEDSTPDYAQIKEKAPHATVAYIQRSRGYSMRKSLTVETIGKMAKAAKEANPNIIVFVDNCYGEFVDFKEPTEVGADLMAGSLIKNPGGAIARTGGYIAGRKDLVELCAYRLTSVGLGKEIGCTLGQNEAMFMGLFFAPSVVVSAVKTSIFASALYSLMGYETSPHYSEPRSDIIMAISLGSEEKMCAFCQGIQKGAPVDSYVMPEPSEMAGYESKVIMAAGAFHNGSSIELSADGPIREPYAVWMQGGITYNTGKIGAMLAANELLKLQK